MKWVVDTCVIIDVFRGDDEFSELSADALSLYPNLTIYNPVRPNI